MPNILKTEKKVAIIFMFCEGASIRAVERITGVHGDTIGRLAMRVGEACKRIMDEKMRDLNCQQIEVDESKVKGSVIKGSVNSNIVFTEDAG